MLNRKPPRTAAFLLAFVITCSLLAGLDRLAHGQHAAGRMAAAASAPALAVGANAAPRS